MAGWLVFIDIASSGANPSPFVSDGRRDGQTGGRRPGGTGCPHFTFVRFGGATERFPGVRRSLIVVYTTRSAVCRLISDAFQSPPPPSECRRRRRSQTNGAASNQSLCDAILPSSAAPVRRTTARWPHTARRTALLRLRRYIARDDDINHELLLSPTHSQTGNLLPRLLPLAWGFTVRLWTWLRSRRVFHEDRDGVIRVRNY